MAHRAGLEFCPDAPDKLSVWDLAKVAPTVDLKEGGLPLRTGGACGQ